MTELEKLSKYAKKQPLLRQTLQGPHSAIMIRVERAVTQEHGLGVGEVTAVLETLDKLLSPPNQALVQLTSQTSTTPSALGLLSVAQHLTLLIGKPALTFQIKADHSLARCVLQE